MISVITPTYNRKHFLGNLLNSLATVTFPVQHIIVDNNSQDGTATLIERFKHKSKAEIIYIREKCTQTEALNIGLGHTKYDWLGWINSDDYYTENGILLLKNSIEQNPDVAFGGMHVRRYNGNHEYMPPHQIEFINRKLSTGCRIWQPTVLLKKKFILEVGGWPKEYEYTQDYWLWAQALMRKKKLVRIDAPIAVLTDHGNRLTRSHIENKDAALKKRFHAERNSVIKMLQAFERRKQ